MQQALLGVILAPVRHIRIARRSLACFIVDMRLVMRAVGVAGVACQGTLDSLGSQRHLACLDLRKGMTAEEPPVLAIMRQQGGGEGQLLGLAPGLAGKADQAEDADAGLYDHHIAGVGCAMRADEGIGLAPLALDQQAEHVDLACLALGQTTCQGARHGHRIQCLGAAGQHLQLAGKGDMRQGKTLIGSDGLAKPGFAFRPCGEERVDATNIGFPRGLGICRYRIVVAVLKHNVLPAMAKACHTCRARAISAWRSVELIDALAGFKPCAIVTGWHQQEDDG